MRRIALGYFVQSREDTHAHRNLLRINADQARLSNMLKMLTGKAKNEEINTLMKEILETQKILKQAAMALLYKNDQYRP